MLGPPEGKPAASEGADGEVRGSRSSLVRMRDMDPPEVPLRQAPYNTPQDVASNSRSLVQVAEQAHSLVQRCCLGVLGSQCYTRPRCWTVMY